MRVIVALPLAAVFLLAGCKSANIADGAKSAGSAFVGGVKDVAGAGASLINVDLKNVLNDLALDLKIDKSSIPINAQIPINVAANVCGVSINILSIGAGGGSSQGCTANSISPELAQYIQQQIAANGSVGGGGQTNGGSATGPTTTPPPIPTTPPPTTPTAPAPSTPTEQPPQ